MSHELALEQTHSPIAFERIGKPRTNLNLPGLTQSRKRKNKSHGTKMVCYVGIGFFVVFHLVIVRNKKRL